MKSTNFCILLWKRVSNLHFLSILSKFSYWIEIIVQFRAFVFFLSTCKFCQTDLLNAKYSVTENQCLNDRNNGFLLSFKNELLSVYLWEANNRMNSRKYSNVFDHLVVWMISKKFHFTSTILHVYKRIYFRSSCSKEQDVHLTYVFIVKKF